MASKVQDTGMMPTGIRKPPKPEDTPWLQQRMPAWRPIYNHKTSAPLFLAIGALFVGLGAFLLHTDSSVRELRFDYTQCGNLQTLNQLEDMPSANYETHVKNSTTGQPAVQWMRGSKSRTFDGVTKNYTTCTIDFFLPETLQPPIYFYYHLTEFVQNHRKYGESFSRSQLTGKNESVSKLGDSCKPVDAGLTGSDGVERIVYPCGAIANSVFNDTFMDPVRFLDASDTSSETVTYNMSRINITSDTNRGFFKTSTYTIPDQASLDANVVPPPNWAERYPNGYHKGNMFDPTLDEAFMVWMRTAAGPTFAKLAMQNRWDAMERGLYRLELFSHFPIEAAGGKKSIIISTKSSGMGRVSFMSKAYIASGAVSIVLGVYFALSTFYKPPPLKNHEYLHKRQL